MPSGVSPDKLNTPSLSDDTGKEWNQFDQKSESNSSNPNKSDMKNQQNDKSQNGTNVGESSYANINNNTEWASDKLNDGSNNQQNTQNKNQSNNQPTNQYASNVPGNYPTPENQNQFPRMAGFFERIFALFIDAFIIGGINFVVYMIIGVITFGLITLTAFNDNAMSIIFTFVIQIIAWILSLSVMIYYMVHFNTKNGQTPGKKAMKLKVISSKESRYLTAKEVVIRETIGRMLNGLLFGLGYFWYFMSPTRQEWHDSLVHSIVVKTDPAGNIYMDGPSSYKKEPIKTFLPLSIFLIIFVGAIVSYTMFLSMFFGSLYSISNTSYDYDSSSTQNYGGIYDSFDNETNDDAFDEMFEEVEKRNNTANKPEVEEKEIITNDPSYTPPASTYDDEELSDGISDGVSDGIVSNLLETVTKKDEASDLKRTNDANSIILAIHRYILENNAESPSNLIEDGSYYQIGSCTSGGASLCSFAKDQCVNLRTDLVPQYLSEMPIDPTEGTPKNTGYAIMVDSGDIIHVRACYSNSGKDIEVAR